MNIINSVSCSRWSMNDRLRVVVLEDVATDVTERIVAEFITLAPRAEHCRNDVASLCNRHTSGRLCHRLL